ncbi:polyisoprenoid-binding protein YceI [Rhodoblastus acidophilus]|uniref:YceI family protein n=1 Tax=Rhodoblastus acidophilus TaxID=1074 RepID=UPI00222407AC|nr:YceI family protein [Rhodoblastus acidophilus]MCW2315491.1 polyisoprenoid-binding protein YceI [Rhodoblastus acidophilus]
MFRSFAFSAAVVIAASLPVVAQEASHDPASVQEGAYSIEPAHTRVLFSVSHMGFTNYYGEFPNARGALDLKPKALASSTLEIHIPTASVSTGNAKLNGELASAQWLDAERFPEIVFKAEKITPTGKTTANVTGALTLHGVTRPVTLAAKFHGAGVNVLDKKYTVGFDVSGKIKRSDFGVNTYLPLIGDELDLTIAAAFERN